MYTLQEIAQKAGVSVQSIYKKAKKDAELREMMDLEKVKGEGNSCRYGDGTLNMVYKLYSTVDNQKKPIQAAADGETIEKYRAENEHLKAEIAHYKEEIERLEKDKEFLQQQLTAAGDREKGFILTVNMAQQFLSAKNNKGGLIKRLFGRRSGEENQ